MSLGKRLKYLREQQDITQKDLAKKLNTKQSNISKFESGMLNISTEILKQIAEIFNVSTDYLIGTHDVSEKQLIMLQEAIRQSKNIKDDEYLIVLNEAKESDISAQEIRDFINIIKKRKKDY